MGLFILFLTSEAGRSLAGVGFPSAALSHMGSVCDTSLRGKEWNTVMILCCFFGKSLIVGLLLLEKGKDSTLWDSTTSEGADSHTVHGSKPGCNLVLSSICWLMWQLNTSIYFQKEECIMRAVALPSSEKLFNEKEGGKTASHPSSQMTGFSKPKHQIQQLWSWPYAFFSCLFLSAVASEKLVFVLCWAGGIWGLKVRWCQSANGWELAGWKTGLQLHCMGMTHAVAHSACFGSLNLIKIQRSHNREAPIKNFGCVRCPCKTGYSCRWNSWAIPVKKLGLYSTSNLVPAVGIEETRIIVHVFQERNIWVSRQLFCVAGKKMCLEAKGGNKMRIFKIESHELSKIVGAIIWDT